jgi:hypothetical protein
MKVLAKRHTVEVDQHTNSSADGGSPWPVKQLPEDCVLLTLFTNNYDISDK